MLDTTTNPPPPEGGAGGGDRGDLLARADAAFGDAIKVFARAEGIELPAARAIRRNKVAQIGDAVIEAKQIHEVVRQFAAHDKG